MPLKINAKQAKQVGWKTLLKKSDHPKGKATSAAKAKRKR